MKEDSDISHILEVDIEYPKELHDLYNDYPYCPEQVVVKEDMLSDYCKMIYDKHNLNIGNTHKLIPNLQNKEKYVIHERNLKQAVDAGLIITKFHRILQFKQKPWMKEYIDFNTEKRKFAKNDFEKDFFKLMNNSVYGKTMENVRKRQNIKLRTSDKLLNKDLSDPRLINRKIFDEDLVATHMIKEFIGLRSKMYSILMDDDKDDGKRTAKGIGKSVIRRELKHKIYKDILDTSGRMYSKFKVIRSEKHRIYTMEINKVSLSAYDDKRYILDNGISSYAYGHYMIPIKDLGKVE